MGLHLTVVLAVAAWVGLAAWQRGVGELLLTLAVLLLLSLSEIPAMGAGGLWGDCL